VARFVEVDEVAVAFFGLFEFPVHLQGERQAEERGGAFGLLCERLTVKRFGLIGALGEHQQVGLQEARERVVRIAPADAHGFGVAGLLVVERGFGDAGFHVVAARQGVGEVQDQYGEQEDGDDSQVGFPDFQAASPLQNMLCRRGRL